MVLVRVAWCLCEGAVAVNLETGRHKEVLVKIQAREEARNCLPAKEQLPQAKVFEAGCPLPGPWFTPRVTGRDSAGRTTQLASRVEPPSTLERPGQRLSDPVAPPQPQPGPGLALAGGGASGLAAPGFSPLVVAAARARKRAGAEAAEAEVPRAGRGCGAVLDSWLLRPAARPQCIPRLRARWATACGTGRNCSRTSTASR